MEVFGGVGELPPDRDREFSSDSVGEFLSDRVVKFSSDSAGEFPSRVRERGRGLGSLSSSVEGGRGAEVASSLRLVGESEGSVAERESTLELPLSPESPESLPMPESESDDPRPESDVPRPESDVPRSESDVPMSEPEAESPPLPVRESSIVDEGCEPRVEPGSPMKSDVAGREAMGELMPISFKVPGFLVGGRSGRVNSRGFSVEESDGRGEGCEARLESPRSSVERSEPPVGCFDGIGEVPS